MLEIVNTLSPKINTLIEAQIRIELIKNSLSLIIIFVIMGLGYLFLLKIKRKKDESDYKAALVVYIITGGLLSFGVIDSVYNIIDLIGNPEYKILKNLLRK